VPQGFLKRKMSTGTTPLPKLVSENKYSLLTVQEVPETESSERRLPEKRKEEARRTVNIRSVLIGQENRPTAPTSIKAIPGYRFTLNVTLRQDNGKTIDAKALVDSRCDTSSVDRKWVAEKRLDTLPLPEVIKVRNADGSPNANRPSVNSLPGTLLIGDHTEEVSLMVTDLPKQYPIFLGLDWLNKHVLRNSALAIRPLSRPTIHPSIRSGAAQSDIPESESDPIWTRHDR
jgi:hypothetical protein